MIGETRRKGRDRRSKQTEVVHDQRDNIERRRLANRRARDERRVFLSNRRSYIERRKRNKQYPHKNRRSGIGRRVLLSTRRGNIDRRDKAFFESLINK